MKKLVAGIMVAGIMTTGFGTNLIQAKGSGETVEPTGNEFFWAVDKAFKGDNFLSWVNADENYEIYHVSNVEDNNITKKQLRTFVDAYTEANHESGYQGVDARVLSFDRETNDLFVLIEYNRLDVNQELPEVDVINWDYYSAYNDFKDWTLINGFGSNVGASSIGDKFADIVIYDWLGNESDIEVIINKLNGYGLGEVTSYKFRQSDQNGTILNLFFDGYTLP